MNYNEKDINEMATLAFLKVKFFLSVNFPLLLQVQVILIQTLIAIIVDVDLGHSGEVGAEDLVGHDT